MISRVISPSQALVTRRRSTTEDVINQIDNVRNVDFSVAVYISIPRIGRRRTAAEHVGYQINDIGDIHITRSVNISAGSHRLINVNGLIGELTHSDPDYS